MALIPVNSACFLCLLCTFQTSRRGTSYKERNRGCTDWERGKQFELKALTWPDLSLFGDIECLSTVCKLLLVLAWYKLNSHFVRYTCSASQWKTGLCCPILENQKNALVWVRGWHLGENQMSGCTTITDHIKIDKHQVEQGEYEKWQASFSKSIGNI